MTPADALTWLIGLSAVVAIVSNARHSGLARGWLGVFVAILALVLLGATLRYDALVYAATGAWVLLVIVPSLARRREQELLEAFRFDAAVRWARVAAWLHPLDDFPGHVTFVRALGESIRGNRERARALLGEIDGSPELRELARIELLRVDRDYRGIIERVNAPGGTRLKAAHVMPYLRALGETGDVSRLLSTYAGLSPPLRRIRAVRLVVLAFAGRPDLLRVLLETGLARDPAVTKGFWLAVAEQASGDRASATKRLEALREGEFLREQIDQRLLTPVPVADPADLTPQARQVLAELEHEIRDARALTTSSAPRRAIATMGLMVVLLAVFAAAAVFGKSEEGGPTIQLNALIRFGALVLPPELTGGAWWRVVTAGFLHVNETHLVMNLLGLWVLGRSVERTSGPLATLVAFLASSIGAYTTGLFFMHADAEHPAVALGASAGVLGLVGALASFAGTGYLLGRNRVLGRQLVGMGVIVVIQLIFDAYHPGVSSFLHLAGAGWGAVVALPYALYTFRPSGRMTRR